MISSIEAADEDKYTCAVSTVNKEEISHILRVRSKFLQTHFLIIFLYFFLVFVVANMKVVLLHVN